MKPTITAGVLGASGFAGAELMRLCADHPDLEVVFAGAGSSAGKKIGELYPSLMSSYPDMEVSGVDDLPTGLDVVFLAMPHGASQDLVPGLGSSLIIDLGSDYRFNDLKVYEEWYGSSHRDVDNVGRFTYGLVELFRDQIVDADSVAVPGCYVTASVLAMAPLLKEGVASPEGIVVDAMSGVSGAGKEPKASTAFTTVAENLTAYGLLSHRHTPEMQMALARHCGTPTELIFTPHLVPTNRGILATCYLRPTSGHDTDALLDIIETSYKADPFITVTDGIPSTKATLGSNSVHITVRSDARTGWIVAISALDNLVKGAAGHAIQCANIALGLEETTGLPIAGTFP